MIRIAVTIDQEWCPAPVVEWVMDELDAKAIRATFFATDTPRVHLRGHETAVHPNPFRPGHGDMVEEVKRLLDIYPEAIGLRMHRLAWESSFEESLVLCGIQYVSAQMVPNQTVRPFRLGKHLVHFPIFYMDHHELINRSLFRPSFSRSALSLEDGGHYVFDFHPNMLFTNAPTEAFYRERVHPSYQTPESLARLRYSGRGCCDLFRDILAMNSDSTVRFVTLAESFEDFRKAEAS